MKRYLFVIVLVVGLVDFAGHAVAEGDAAKGEKLFKGFLVCSSCHSLEVGETKVGPTLAGLFGRRAGSVEGYKWYSKAMANSKVVWDEETLSEFLENPMKFIPGNKMEFSPGGVVPIVSSNQLRTDLIAYLKKATVQ